MDLIDELDVVRISAAFSDLTRFLIYKHIKERSEMRHQDICVEASVRAATVSHHLKVLVDAGLIDSRREGQAVYYKAIASRIKAYSDYFDSSPLQ